MNSSKRILFWIKANIDKIACGKFQVLHTDLPANIVRFSSTFLTNRFAWGIEPHPRGGKNTENIVISFTWGEKVYCSYKAFFIAILLLLVCNRNVSADLILHYDFDGQAIDQTGRGNDGTIVGSPSFQPTTTDQGLFVNNPIGNNEATEFVIVPFSTDIQNLSTSSLTVGIRYKTADPINDNGRLAGEADLSLEYNAGNRDKVSATLQNTLFNDESNDLGIATDSQFHWQFVVIERNATNLDVSLYLDGNLLDSGLASLTPVMELGDFRVGAAGGSLSRP